MTNLIVRFFLSLQSYHFAFIKKIIPDKKIAKDIEFHVFVIRLEAIIQYLNKY